MIQPKRTLIGAGVLFGMLIQNQALAIVPPTPPVNMKISESTQFISPKSSWFLRSDLNTALAIKGATGVGLSAGKMGKFIFVDFSTMFYSTAYGTIKVAQPNLTAENKPEDKKEIGRMRGDGDAGNVWSLGPGIGFIYKFFGSKNVIEIGRFGVNYSQFKDLANSVTFKGWLFNFHAALGYQLGSFIIAPGLTWNLGFMSRTHPENASGDPQGHFASGEPSNVRFLPIQWWAWHIDVIFWL